MHESRNDATLKRHFHTAEHDRFLEIEVRKAADAPPPVPFERSYWVLPGKFLAGAYPGDPDSGAAKRKLHAFLMAGIRWFLDLTEEMDRNMLGQFLVPYADLLVDLAGHQFNVIYRRIPIADLHVPTHAQMQEIQDMIDGSIISGIPIYVHCLGGIGRTGTVVGCWLVRHGIAQGGEAIDLIRKLRRKEPRAQFASPETDEQRQFIIDWQRGD